MQLFVQKPGQNSLQVGQFDKWTFILLDSPFSAMALTEKSQEIASFPDQSWSEHES